MSRTIVLAGGGSAGHVEPALAVAREWMEQHPNDRCIFLGTAQGLETTLVSAAGFSLHLIPKVPGPRSLSPDLLIFPLRLFHSVIATRKVIAGADLLIGFGGYVSAPAYLAAWSKKIPIVIHDANAKIGWANELGARFTRFLAAAHPISEGRFINALQTGLPLREDVQRAAHASSSDWVSARKSAKIALGWQADQPTILVLGGSQGSVLLNSTIAKAQEKLTHAGIAILHSVGAKNEVPPSSKNYRAIAYLQDMATAYLGSDLLIARSGAVTCAEFGALGKMALFIPLAIGNGEQERNADSLVESGRAVVLPQSDFSSDWLSKHVDELLKRSAKNAPEGATSDLWAAKSIVSLMEHALKESVS